MLKVRERVLERSQPEPNSGCWLWTGSLSGNGRPQMLFTGKSQAAARVAYQAFVGPIAPKAWILHKCDTSICVNPDHLYQGDRARNIQDAVDRKRLPMGSRHPKAKLNEVLVTIMRSLHKKGWSARRLTIAFPVSREEIGKICSGRAWRHVPR